jgi:hypothetical protein
LSEKESVVSAESGEPLKKFVVVRSSERIRAVRRIPGTWRKEIKARTLEVLKEVSHCLSLIF